MKRLLSLILILALLLSGCGQSRVENPPAPLTPAPDTELTAQLLLENILPAVPEGSEAHEIVPHENIPVFLEIYGISQEQAEDCAIARMGGARVFEVTVLRVSDGAEEDIGGVLSAYLRQRQGDFTGYAPEQAALAEEGVILTATPWMVLVISEDTAAARAAFEACVSGGAAPVTPSPAGTDAPEDTPLPEVTDTPTPEPTEEGSPAPSDDSTPSSTAQAIAKPEFELPRGWKPYVPPHTDDMTIYDTSAILAAWAAGSSESLSRKDIQIYERCEELIDRLITDDMTAYEKEWAVYRWLIREVDYDWRQNDPAATAPRASFEPFGALVWGQAVCLGYASTFQLFMDLLGIECITVVGAAFDSEGDHAWNMVKLNGEWYCVDATWDLGRSSPDRCKYFNVTSDHMAKTDHQWDYANTPMATATDGGR